MTSSPGCRHGDVDRSSRSSTGDAGKKLSGVSENMPSVEVCETCLTPQILASAGPKERLLTLKMNGQPQPSEKTSPTGKMVSSDSDHQVATTKTPSPLSSQQQCVVGKSSRGSSNTSLASIKDHVTQILANGKSSSSNSLSDQRVTERKSSRSSEHERKSSRSSDQNRIIISSNNNEPMSDSNEIQNHQGQREQQRVSVSDVKVIIQEHSSESQIKTLKVFLLLLPQILLAYKRKILQLPVTQILRIMYINNLVIHLCKELSGPKELKSKTGSTVAIPTKLPAQRLLIQFQQDQVIYQKANQMFRSSKPL